MQIIAGGDFISAPLQNYSDAAFLSLRPHPDMPQMRLVLVVVVNWAVPADRRLALGLLGWRHPIKSICTQPF
ncbi:hypothetical protein CCGE531_26400 (plasmid) [Rhizobium sp. CCGE531]|nr:hypothetical protein CCGE531_26400 [Rhizobium sp. CCGE531]AYG76045.1 hypothetical protein CCGE532_25885 [Rhizobium sp. CCGE532]